MAFVSEIVLQPAEEATEQPTATPTVVPVQTPEPTKFSENVLNQMIWLVHTFILQKSGMNMEKLIFSTIIISRNPE